MKEKRTDYTVDFFVPVDHRWKNQRKKTVEKYLNLAKEIKKKLYTIKVMVIPTVIGLLEKDA